MKEEGVVGASPSVIIDLNGRGREGGGLLIQLSDFSREHTKWEEFGFFFCVLFLFGFFFFRLFLCWVLVIFSTHRWGVA